jgi:hypothetical protein
VGCIIATLESNFRQAQALLEAVIEHARMVSARNGYKGGAGLTAP